MHVSRVDCIVQAMIWISMQQLCGWRLFWLQYQSAGLYDQTTGDQSNDNNSFKIIFCLGFLNFDFSSF